MDRKSGGLGKKQALKCLELAVIAGREVMKVYEKETLTVEDKVDGSPLTKADKISNEIIVSGLRSTSIPIISEESSLTDYEVRKDWNWCWLIDPVDGTKEFIEKNGEFTINIALIEHGVPVFGVIYAPALKELYYAIVSEASAFKTVIKPHQEISDLVFFSNEDRIAPAADNPGCIRVLGSRSHMNVDTMNFIKGLKLQNEDVRILPKGSSLKFCLVAEGKADFYPRFAPTMEWDTAAGHAICNAVGVSVVDQTTGEQLKYNNKKLVNNNFVVKKEACPKKDI